MATFFEPERVVAVDVGMTCTAVAWSQGPDWGDPKPIQRWPGTLSLDIRNKVPTSVEYDEQSGKVVGWGFSTLQQAKRPTRVAEFFKLSLDPSFSSEDGATYSFNEAHEHFSNFLDSLFDATEDFFQSRFRGAQETRVEFLFSTPTTWKSPKVIRHIEESIRKSRFGRRPNSMIKMGLTEAEAAAVYAAKQQFRKGDVVIVCDAGGGTTDVNTLKIESAGRNGTELMPLSWVEGESIGSTIIDYKMENLIISRLEQLGHLLPIDVEPCAKSMMGEGLFERFKCSFGSGLNAQPALIMPIPYLDAIDMPSANIERGRLIITSNELERIFDEQVDKIISLIDGQIQKLQRTAPMEVISYLVLSGGLGSSPYVQNALKDRYKGLKVLVAEEPQLVVALGLVMDRVQELQSGSAIFPQLRARKSYGILTRDLYHPIRHMDEHVIIDKRDGRKWATHQIHWLIKKGQLVSVKDGVKYHYDLKLNFGQLKNPWKMCLVTSDLPPEELPISLKHEGAHHLCRVESSIDPNLMKRKNSHWWQLSHEYYHVRLLLKVLVGAADLRFQIWSMDNQRCSKDHDEIHVDWDNATIDHNRDSMKSEINSYSLPTLVDRLSSSQKSIQSI